ncbi:SDR family oxidoreductase [Priestia megaterium]|uniref:SDR family oxidoreductase n=1 Tax=Priestia megaterium TaxID=1404 RepID=UPI003A809D44
MNIVDKFNLKGKCSIITGGAGDLGFVMAEGLAQAKSNIIIADTNSEKIQEAVNKLKNYDVRVIGLEIDITNEADVKKLREDSVEQFGKIDVLINCAGILRHSNFIETSLKDFTDTMNVNVTGTFLNTREIGKQMIKQGSGSIINIASMSGQIVNTPQCHVAYNVSKAAVLHMTKCTAAEWAQYGIRANSISPGYINSGMAVPMFEEGGEMVDRWMSLSPMKRPGTADELVGAVLYLASDASTFTNGTDILIDGAYSVW